MPNVSFYTNDVNPKLQHRTKLKEFIQGIFKNEKKQLTALSIIFCTDDFLLEINKSALKHNYYTDIITFDLSEHPEQIIGEIYISIDRVAENAKTFAQSYQRELHRVMFHGALHLCGYKDKKPTDQKIIRKMEDKYLSKYFM